jgi:hypothetical protein
MACRSKKYFCVVVERNRHAKTPKTQSQQTTVKNEIEDSQEQEEDSSP